MSVLYLTGCGNEKATGEENYFTNEVIAMKINADTWNTNGKSRSYGIDETEEDEDE